MWYVDLNGDYKWLFNHADSDIEGDVETLGGFNDQPTVTPTRWSRKKKALFFDIVDSKGQVQHTVHVNRLGVESLCTQSRYDYLNEPSDIYSRINVFKLKKGKLQRVKDITIPKNNVENYSIPSVDLWINNTLQFIRNSFYYWYWSFLAAVLLLYLTIQAPGIIGEFFNYGFNGVFHVFAFILCVVGLIVYFLAGLITIISIVIDRFE